MKTIEEMLRTLARTDVTEFAVVSDRLPCVKVNGKFEPIDDVAQSTDSILEILVSAGGSRYVDRLGPRPSQWSTRIDGVGMIAVTALLREEVVQARIIVTKRETRGGTVGRADIDPRARGLGLGNLSPPPPPPAAAHALVDSEPVFDLEGNSAPGVGSISSRADALDLEADLLDDPSVSVPPSSGLGAASAVRSAPQTPIPPAGTIENLLFQARRANASDLHVVPERPILLRIAGDLLPRGEVVDDEFVANIVDAIVPGRLRPQLETEGSCDFAVNDPRGRCRVNVSRQRTGYKVCVRLISSEVPTLESLGLPPQIANATHHHQGLILVTGPTGHGKTSTLAAIVNLINTNTTHHIITVEDPVEYIHPRKKALMSQREVGANTRSFQSALKGSLREDPDVIVVGELRDTETVRMALSASETGHLVIGTMNTPSAAKTIDRLIDLFPPIKRRSG